MMNVKINVYYIFWLYRCQIWTKLSYLFVKLKNISKYYYFFQFYFQCYKFDNLIKEEVLIFRINERNIIEL